MILWSGLFIVAYNPNVADESFGNPVLMDMDDSGLYGDTGELGDGSFDGLTNESALHL